MIEFFEGLCGTLGEIVRLLLEFSSIVLQLLSLYACLIVPFMLFGIGIVLLLILCGGVQIAAILGMAWPLERFLAWRTQRSKAQA